MFDKSPKLTMFLMGLPVPALLVVLGYFFAIVLPDLLNSQSVGWVHGTSRTIQDVSIVISFVLLPISYTVSYFVVLDRFRKGGMPSSIVQLPILVFAICAVVTIVAWGVVISIEGHYWSLTH